jgi:hypothetical protein
MPQSVISTKLSTRDLGKPLRGFKNTNLASPLRLYLKPLTTSLILFVPADPTTQLQLGPPIFRHNFILTSNGFHAHGITSKTFLEH